MATGTAKVCVTGAGGYISSWVVNLLLSKGYIVHGTVRDPKDEKNAHLYKLDKASENLKLFKAELLDYDSLYSAILGCKYVIHAASPVPASKVSNPQVEVIERAVKGTLNVLKASQEAKVTRVVYVSSETAVSINPNWPKDKVMDETCWSDKEYIKSIENWYGVSKIEAEMAALEYAKETKLDLVSVCPTLVLGPLLQSTVNASSLYLISYLKASESVQNPRFWVVDVRDVAQALVLAFEKSEAEGRYICTAHPSKAQGMVDQLKSKYPDYTYPKSYTEGWPEVTLSSEKLQKLGWRFRPLEETLVDSVECYRKAGILKL